jgi:hypothetical protein
MSKRIIFKVTGVAIVNCSTHTHTNRHTHTHRHTHRHTHTKTHTHTDTHTHRQTLTQTGTHTHTHTHTNCPEENWDLYLPHGVKHNDIKYLTRVNMCQVP